MGLRRIRLCKNCGRKFTPRSQKLLKVTDEQTTETAVELDEATEPHGTNKPNLVVAEPTSDSKPLLSVLDKEWTS